jgi:hypothetical protein
MLPRLSEDDFAANQLVPSEEAATSQDGGSKLKKDNGLEDEEKLDENPCMNSCRNQMIGKAFYLFLILYCKSLYENV